MTQYKNTHHKYDELYIKKNSFNSKITKIKN